MLDPFTNLYAPIFNTFHTYCSFCVGSDSFFHVVLFFLIAEETVFCNKIRQPKEGNHISSKGEYYCVQIRKLLKELRDELGLLCAVLIFL